MYDIDLLERKFAALGARVRARALRRYEKVDGVALDIQSDRRGEFFEVIGGEDDSTRVEVLDVKPDDRHLLLLVRRPDAKRKFLCGHDERHWFVAAIPEDAPVGTVAAAKQALKPPEVRDAQARAGLNPRRGDRRKNAANLRQGEWFFIPAPDLKVDSKRVIHDEPIRRGRGKPHLCEFVYREGGEPVRVCRRYPNGVDETTYTEILAREPGANSWKWQSMVRDARVYARGRVRHPDHRTITLNGWHRVVMNTETRAVAMANVAFLD